jgi:hypothetical protein
MGMTWVLQNRHFYMTMTGEMRLVWSTLGNEVRAESSRVVSGAGCDMAPRVARAQPTRAQTAPAPRGERPPAMVMLPVCCAESRRSCVAAKAPSVSKQHEPASTRGSDVAPLCRILRAPMAGLTVPMQRR